MCLSRGRIASTTVDLQLYWKTSLEFPNDKRAEEAMAAPVIHMVLRLRGGDYTRDVGETTWLLGFVPAAV